MSINGKGRKRCLFGEERGEDREARGICWDVCVCVCMGEILADGPRLLSYGHS